MASEQEPDSPAESVISGLSDIMLQWGSPNSVPLVPGQEVEWTESEEEEDDLPLDSDNEDVLFHKDDLLELNHKIHGDHITIGRPALKCIQALIKKSARCVMKRARKIFKANKKKMDFKDAIEQAIQSPLEDHTGIKIHVNQALDKGEEAFKKQKKHKRIFKKLINATHENPLPKDYERKKCRNRKPRRSLEEEVKEALTD